MTKFYSDELKQEARMIYLSTSKTAACKMVYQKTALGWRRSRKFVEEYCTPTKLEIAGFRLGDL